MDHRCPKNHHQLCRNSKILLRTPYMYSSGRDKATIGLSQGWCLGVASLGWDGNQCGSGWPRQTRKQTGNINHGMVEPCGRSPSLPWRQTKYGHGTSGYRSIDFFFLKEHVCAWCFDFSHSRLVPVRKFSQVPGSWLLAPGPGKLEAPSHTNPADMTCV